MIFSHTFLICYQRVYAQCELMYLCSNCEFCYSKESIYTEIWKYLNSENAHSARIVGMCLSKIAQVRMVLHEVIGCHIFDYHAADQKMIKNIHYNVRKKG